MSLPNSVNKASRDASVTTLKRRTSTDLLDAGVFASTISAFTASATFSSISVIIPAVMSSAPWPVSLKSILTCSSIHCGDLKLVVGLPTSSNLLYFGGNRCSHIVRLRARNSLLAFFGLLRGSILTCPQLIDGKNGPRRHICLLKHKAQFVVMPPVANRYL